VLDASLFEVFAKLADKAGGHLTRKKGRKHSKSAHVFYFTVSSSLWAIKCYLIVHICTPDPMHYSI